MLLVANSLLLREEVILHGVDLSKRMNASLEILHLLDKDPGDAATQKLKANILKLNPSGTVGYIPLLKHSGLTTETVDYAKNRRNILCIVLCLKDEVVQSGKNVHQEKFEKITKSLNCPVVLYKDTPSI